VPKSPDNRVRTPIPIIYCNFRGWLKPAEPITIERLIPPDWLYLSSNELKWKKTSRNGKEAYVLPEEEVYVKIGVSEDKIIFSFDIKKYHLERTSIRGVNPEKWTNWAMFYINLDYIDDLLNTLKNYIPSNTPVVVPKVEKEVQQGGKEVTYHVTVPVVDFSLCLGCFDLVQRYLYIKAREHCIIDPASNLCRNPEEAISKLKLRLKFSPRVDTFAKVGIAKISGKRPQIMVKLASEGPMITINGVLKQVIEGKARGELVYCNHEAKEQYIVLDLIGFYRALDATRKYIDKLPRE